MRTIRDEAIILRKRSLLSKDEIITFFSKNHGKINVFAKGVKKMTSRRLPHLQTANLVKIILNNQNGNYYLHETVLISGFAKIKDNEGKQELLYQMLFILERILPEDQVEEKIYDLLKQFLINLSKNAVFSPNQFNDYLNEIMSILGFIYQKKTLSELYLLIEDIIHEKIPFLNI